MLRCIGKVDKVQGFGPCSQETTYSSPREPQLFPYCFNHADGQVQCGIKLE